MQEILNILLDIIAKEGPDYPVNNPYPTYLTMLEKGADPRKARLLHLTILAGIPQIAKVASQEELVETIQREFCLKSKPAESLATLYTKLYSPAQKANWEEQNEAGFRDFCGRTWKYKWNGNSTWNGDPDWIPQGGELSHHDSEYTASFSAEFMVVDEELTHDAVEDLLSKNPFADAETIWKFISARLTAALDADFDDYVNADVRFSPYMELYWESTEMPDYPYYGLEIINGTDSYDASDVYYPYDDDDD